MRFRSIREIAQYMVNQGITYMYLPKRSFNLSGADIPNAGPRPNVYGMRRNFYGRNALLVKQGEYVYKVGMRRN